VVKVKLCMHRFNLTVAKGCLPVLWGCPKSKFSKLSLCDPNPSPPVVITGNEHDSAGGRDEKMTFGVSLFILLLASTHNITEAFSGNVSLGKGSFTAALPPDRKAIPPKQYLTTEVTQRVPSNKWWSSLVWLPYSEAQYPHPLAVRALPQGMQVYFPKSIHADSDGIYGQLPKYTPDDFILGHSGVVDFPDAKLDGFSDWFVSALFEKGRRKMRLTYGHGSPYIYAIYHHGDPKLVFPETPQVWYDSGAVLGITVNGKCYGLFGPSGSTWSGLSTRTFINHLGTKKYFSLACLPGKSESILLQFGQYAHNHIKDTKVTWSFDPLHSRVHTIYNYETISYEGAVTGTIFALYPHQWNNTSHKLLPCSYPSVRGTMKIAIGAGFETHMDFPGVLPSLPDCGSYDKTKLQSYIRQAAVQEFQGPFDTYFYGKYLGKIASLISLSEQVEDTDSQIKLTQTLKESLECWFSASDQNEAAKTGRLFYYDASWGTVVGYPASFGSDSELNDHHFHYGYFIRAAAEIARRDPDWAHDNHWGAMVRLLIRDIASYNRTDDMFPFLRSFDSYAGHSWASGHAKFEDGNNQESSSEAMNAWTALILWGEATNDRILRDLGIYLYTTEMYAIHEYWFDSRRRNCPSGYSPSVVTMVWGGKGVNTTWWTANPEEVHGINWLPFHGGSLYLGRFPDYVHRNYRALVKENQGARWDKWADLIQMWLALADPEEAIRQFELDADSLTPEEGNSLANTYHWIYNLNALGKVDQSITADYPIYAVFDSNGVKTYVVYNMTAAPLPVNFSDGQKAVAAPRQFTVKNNLNQGDYHEIR
jgi:endoglucanase Acf2